MGEPRTLGVILEIKAGPFAGKRIEVRQGETFTVGRTSKAKLAIPHDTFMSGLHFSVECAPKGVLLTDQKSSNGTFVNGGRVTQVFLTSGDEVRSGQTVFGVQMVADEALSPAPVQPAAPPPPSPLPPLGAPPPRPAAPLPSLGAPPIPSSALPPLGAPVAAPPPPRTPQPPPSPVEPPQMPSALPPIDPEPLASPVPVAPPPPPPVVNTPERIVPREDFPPPAKHAPPPTPPPPPPVVPSQRKAVRAAHSPSHGAVTLGAWSFSTVPPQWEVQGEFGFQSSESNGFPSNVVATQESLGAGLSLQQYVESQVATLRQYLREPQIEAALPPQIPGAEETVALEVRYKTRDGQAMFYHRIYARTGHAIGVLTCTTLESELDSVRPAFDAILSGAGFAPEGEG